MAAASSGGADLHSNAGQHDDDDGVVPGLGQIMPAEDSIEPLGSLGAAGSRMPEGDLRAPKRRRRAAKDPCAPGPPILVLVTGSRLGRWNSAFLRRGESGARAMVQQRRDQLELPLQAPYEVCVYGIAVLSSWEFPSLPLQGARAKKLVV